MTLPQYVSALVLLALGGGVLAVAWRGGMALSVWGLLALVGMAPPLRLH